MKFTSFEFIIFFIVVFFLYWFALRKNLKGQNILLLISSYFFYGYWDYRNLIPDYYIQSYIELIEQIKQKDSSIKVFDYSNMEMNNRDYGDYHHVNKFGAIKVSEKIIVDLR
jgi:D-alanyl-lipoteichoic acid acyltransferase DltB (MBOAT superfamily)